MNDKLYRYPYRGKIGGVCEGLGIYFDIDPVIIRLIMILAFFMGSFGLLVYVIGWIIIPKSPNN